MSKTKFEYTPFGARLSTGESMRMLSHARQFFADWHGVNIYSYQFTKQTPTRPLDNLPKGALKECFVCGKPLYSFSSADQDPALIQVRASTHCLFRDDMGEDYHTCYKLKSCFNAMGFEPVDEITTVIAPPTFERFHNLEVGKSKDENDSVAALRASYEADVMPFLRKWCNMDIHKKNVMTFIQELREAQDKHLLFFADPDSKKVVAKKLLVAIGVDNVKKSR